MNVEESLEPIDPVTAAAEKLLGVKYLYPYQRLVVANILEAACASGLRVEWPEGGPETAASELERAAERDGEAEDPEEKRETASDLGRQIVILPTGAGKSLCFQLPALLLSRPTLVLYPILSLMSDQERRLSERGFAPALLRGGQDTEERRKIWNRLSSGDARFVIANPEVLLTESVMSRLRSVDFAHVVIDEAHCVSEWGESFRPSYLRVADILRASGAPLATAFTATASPEVLEKIRKYVFGDLPARLIVGNPDRPNIDYSAMGTLIRERTVVNLVRREAKPAIVFCASRARTERLARLLRAELPDVETRFYHAGLERDEKTDVEKWFFSNSNAVLTATTAYGLGVDKADIRTVIHRDCPPNVEAYLQESGRAGRDGKPSRAILLWGPEDERAVERAAQGADKDRQKALLSYARSAARCRREKLLELLGAACEYCPGCDVCRKEASGRYRERRAVLDFVRRNTRRYTRAEAAAIIAERSPDGWTEDDAVTALRLLEAEGELRTLRGFLWKRKLVPAAKSDDHSSSATSTSSGPEAAPFFAGLGAFTLRGVFDRGGRLRRAT